MENNVDTKTPFSTNKDEEICYDKTVAYQEIVLFDSKKCVIVMNILFLVLCIQWPYVVCGRIKHQLGFIF